ncbi:Spore coat protein A [Phytophthora cinnamomi]|uniref:Spore coat protein A n=2 Tax=Phytophthora cinnamomi TaxID=4785 RepID=UPI00355A92F1|nr:Spore coat protein A [Phytophthora cinnamomi]
MVLAKYALTTATAVILSSAYTSALTNLKTDWEAYTSALATPSVIDMTKGGHLDMDIGQATHAWTQDRSISGQVYGYAIMGQTPTFPGPSILVAKDVPISITWHNQLKAPHLLADSIERSILMNESTCYPDCGVPAVTHLHGGEVPAKYDGLPFKTIYTDESREFEYHNRQLESTAIYHDHADGLNRLNTWAGLMGAYIIQNVTREAELNLDIKTDIPLVINDRLIDNAGKLLYSDDNCNSGATVWVPESFGNVNLVNGRVMPYVEIPPTQVRFRVVNAANSRHYQIPIPFPDLCQVVATDSGYVETPQTLGDTLVLFPLERVELVCDFTGVLDGTKYELVDVQSSTQSTAYDQRILQIRIVESLLTDSMTVREIPTTLNKFKSLKTLYEAGGMERNVTLAEMTDTQACPTLELVYSNNKQINITTIADALQCVKGTIEKWNFINPTADAHPFHWHLVHVQCGDTVDAVKTNELKDVAVIPSAGDRAADTITQVCYVACTPGDYLIEDSEREAKDFGFDTTEPYVAHCHILEHEENMMMSWFRIIDDYRAGGPSSASSSAGSENWFKMNSGSGSSYSTSGSESYTHGSNSSPTGGDSSSDAGSKNYNQTEANHADQDGLPAKNVSFANYHGFGTEQYAKYQTGKDHVMTAISSTVVSNSKQDQSGNASSAEQDTQEYVHSNSSSNETADEYTKTTTGQNYEKAGSQIENAASSKTDVKAGDINAKTGTTQSYAETSSDVEDTAVNTGKSDYTRATTGSSADSTNIDVTGMDVDRNQGHSSTKTFGTTVNSSYYKSGTVGKQAGTTSTKNQGYTNTKTSGTTVNSSSYTSGTAAEQADSNEMKVDAGQEDVSSSIVDKTTATNSVKSTSSGYIAENPGYTGTNNIAADIDDEKTNGNAVQSYVKMGSDASAIAGSNKYAYTGVTTGTKTGIISGHVRKCDGE